MLRIEALEEALARYGRPAICNSDHGPQFTSTAFTAFLLCKKIPIGMDGMAKAAGAMACSWSASDAR